MDWGDYIIVGIGAFLVLLKVASLFRSNNSGMYPVVAEKES